MCKGAFCYRNKQNDTPMDKMMPPLATLAAFCQKTKSKQNSKKWVYGWLAIKYLL